MRPASVALGLIVFALAARSAVATEASAGSPLDARAALAVSQAAIGNRVADQQFTDGDGQEVALSSFRGKPLVLSFVYTSCYHTCPTLTQRLRQSVQIARAALGEDAFSVATIGFDTPNDTPERMRAYAHERAIDDPRWSFLSGDSGAVATLLEDVGFTYVTSPRGFDHLMQVTLLDGQGIVRRHIYGETFDPPALVEPLKALYLGRPRADDESVASWLDTLRVLCTVYDPRSGRYAFDYSLAVALATGLLCLSGVAVFIVRAWREHPQKPARG
jgi:protein SCO1/2